jgi:WD40 repeat protein
MKELDDLQAVYDCLGNWWGQIHTRNAQGLYDINRVSEDVAVPLLNLVFNLDLVNLNPEKKNFPGIDLGDKTNGKAFQVTSRTDTTKIKKDIATFYQEHKNRFPGGIRFLLLSDEKPRLSQQECEAICPGFDPGRDILNFPDLIAEIKKIYSEDPSRFQRIRDFLEKEFGPERPGEVDPFKILGEGSQKYYQALRGPNGRFRFLRISDIILPGSGGQWLETCAEPEELAAPEGLNNKKFLQGSPEGALFSKSVPSGRRRPKYPKVLEVLPGLWHRPIKHAVIVGEGGMGKTVSLLHWWEKLLEPGQDRRPIPVFLALNELNQVPDGKRVDFILNRIAALYSENSLSPDQVKKAMNTPGPGEKNEVPALVLLLDGFNEITVDKRELLLELNHLAEQCPGLQLVITSRYDMRGNFNWGHWHLVKLKYLEEEQAAAYLAPLGLALPGPGRLRELIGNPMMLTLYAAAGKVKQDYPMTMHTSFKEPVETTGQLLWNFMEAQVALLPERLAQDEKKIALYKFLLQFFLPGLGYEMEKVGLFDFSEQQLYECMEKLCRRFAREDFFNTFTQFLEFAQDLPLGDCTDTMARFERSAKLKKILCGELSMLVQEGELFRFLHQHFRDFFAAVYILHELDMGKTRGDTTVLRERRLDFNIRRLLGELEGEHRSKSYLSDKKWYIDIDRENRLYMALESMRGEFGAGVGYGVWNIVETWKEVRGELSGADLSGLDLSGVMLNGACCSHFYPGGYLAACFDGARVHEGNLFSRGHSSVVNSAVYSRDGKKILSASYDDTIKEWNTATGECVKTLAGHSNWVTSAIYSRDGKKILSASEDQTIKEWDAATGECVKTLAGHLDRVSSVVYSRDEKKILSASYDQTIKEWDAATGECVKTLAGHSNYVSSAVYSRDGKKILSASEDQTIKEWDAATGECLKTLAGHSNYVSSAVYSRDGKKILSASFDDTIIEWDAATGECLKTLAGHSSTVTSAVYSRDGKKILSASYDQTIKEWDAATGECVKTLAGHTQFVTSAVYSRDGKKILSASWDQTIKEWDAATGECVKTLAGHLDRVSSVVYSRDGKKILSASEDQTIKEWDAATRECVKTLAGHSKEVTSAVYSRDGKKILSASWDQTIKEWDAATGECVKTLAGHSSAVTSAVYSRDGKKILSVSYDQTIKEWDAATGECVKTLAGHSWIVTSAVYSRDGKKILSALADHTIKEWDAETGECLQTWKIDEKPVLNEYDFGENEDFMVRTGVNIIKGKDLVNIPGLFIQGCSFKDLEKGSRISRKNLKILKQYGGRFK